jgi:serine protease DegQ
VFSQANEPAKPDANAAAPRSLNEQQVRRASTVLLRDIRGEQLGSGVIVAEVDGGYWIATNRHVVQDQKLSCVLAGGQSSPAVVMPTGSSTGQGDEDLALLWLPSSKGAVLVVADQSGLPEPPEQLPLVVATGFPTPLKPLVNGPAYLENVGLLLPLLKQPLQGGFSLAYTSVVEKGMSGGGVFQGRRLIGINGAHANPLWPGQWKDQGNKPVSAILNRKLEQVSLGIPLQTIKLKLKTTTAPKSLQQTATELCQMAPGKVAETNQF